MYRNIYRGGGHETKAADKYEVLHISHESSVSRPGLIKKNGPTNFYSFSTQAYTFHNLLVQSPHNLFFSRPVISWSDKWMQTFQEGLTEQVGSICNVSNLFFWKYQVRITAGESKVPKGILWFFTVSPGKWRHSTSCREMIAFFHIPYNLLEIYYATPRYSLRCWQHR
jgi:hypothetical protein